MKICVVTDDNSCFTDQEAKELGIEIVPMPVLINGVCRFQSDLKEDEFFDLLRTNDVRTSQPAPGVVMSLWDRLLEKYDQVLYIPMSSGLSSSMRSAKMMAEDYNNRVFVVDNHRISVTLKSSVRDALNLVKSGKDAAEIRQILEDEGSKSSIYIMVDTLKYLKKGGRVTTAAALIGDTFHIKPVLSLFEEKLDSYAKCIGTKNAKMTMLNAIKNDLNTKFKDFPKDELIFGMAYTHDLNEALLFKDEYMAAFGLKDVEIDPLSYSIATHIGPGSLAVTVSHKIRVD